jgi:hypothetical protein
MSRLLSLDDLHRLLDAEHDRIDHHLVTIAEAFRAGAWQLGFTEWREVEDDLLGHLALEGQLLLPELIRFAPADAAAIARGHAAIRRQAATLGHKLGLQQAGARDVDELIRIIAAYAAREDELLDPWTQARGEHGEATTLTLALAALVGRLCTRAGNHGAASTAQWHRSAP